MAKLIIVLALVAFVSLSVLAEKRDASAVNSPILRSGIASGQETNQANNANNEDTQDERPADDQETDNEIASDGTADNGVVNNANHDDAAESDPVDDILDNNTSSEKE